jgi:hypothetical protein
MTFKVGDVSCALVDKRPEEINCDVENKGFKMNCNLDLPLDFHCFPLKLKVVLMS